jgi:hypothetical protein
MNRTVLTQPPSQGFHGHWQPTHRSPHGHLAAILLVIALGFPEPDGSVVYAQSPAKSLEQQVLEQKKKIEETIVQPCKAERRQKAAQIQKEVIDPCSCPVAQQKQETDELHATLQVELQRCEQKGVDALDQFKHALVAQAPPLEVGKALPEAWLQQFKNEDLRNWIRVNVVCRREPVLVKFGISAGRQLMITPERFNTLDANERINLLAFELGKVFYLRVVEASPSGAQIRNNFLPSEIEEMARAEYQGLSLRGQTPHSLNLGDPPWEGPSGFAYVFRAELFQIPSGNADWKRTQTEFHAIVDPVVRTAGRLQ